MFVLAWHFLSADRRLRHGDGRLMRKGQTLHVEGEPVLCEHGMHGSHRLIDALFYAPGPIIERVEIGADEPYEIVEGEMKFVGNWRKTLWWIDATAILYKFACWEAEYTSPWLAARKMYVDTGWIDDAVGTRQNSKSTTDRNNRKGILKFDYKIVIRLQNCNSITKL